jgi:hypothetical protein
VGSEVRKNKKEGKRQIREKYLVSVAVVIFILLLFRK